MTFKAPKLPARGRKGNGFTIVEILIVLAIATMIIVSVLLVVPAARRTARNNDRKQTVGVIAGELESYGKNNQLTLPGASTDAATQSQEQCEFILDYLTDTAGDPVDPVDCSSPPIDSAKRCVLIELRQYSVCFHNWANSLHSYIGDDKEISIQLAHWCGDDPSSSNYPITSQAGTTPHDVHHYVIWIRMEESPHFCVSNYSN